MHVSVPRLAPRPRNQILRLVFRATQDRRKATHDERVGAVLEIAQLQHADLLEPLVLGPRTGGGAGRAAAGPGLAGEFRRRSAGGGAVGWDRIGGGGRLHCFDGEVAGLGGRAGGAETSCGKRGREG